MNFQLFKKKTFVFTFLFISLWMRNLSLAAGDLSDDQIKVIKEILFDVQFPHGDENSHRLPREPSSLSWEHAQAQLDDEPELAYVQVGTPSLSSCLSLSSKPTGWVYYLVRLPQGNVKVSYFNGVFQSGEFLSE